MTTNQGKAGQEPTRSQYQLRVSLTRHSQEIRSQAVRLTKAADVRHCCIMSDTNTLGKRRTVRFEARIDGLISARAEAEKKSISRVIRDSVIAGLQTGGMTAGDWILSVADNKARSASAERLAFRKKYRERHP